MSEQERPELVTEDHLFFLDDLRESGKTNMFAAPSYVYQAFGVTKQESREIVAYWMKTFSERHSQE